MDVPVPDLFLFICMSLQTSSRPISQIQYENKSKPVISFPGLQPASATAPCTYVDRPMQYNTKQHTSYFMIKLLSRLILLLFGSISDYLHYFQYITTLENHLTNLDYSGLLKMNALEQCFLFVTVH